MVSDVGLFEVVEGVVAAIFFRRGTGWLRVLKSVFFIHELVPSVPKWCCNHTSTSSSISTSGQLRRYSSANDRDDQLFLMIHSDFE